MLTFHRATLSGGAIHASHGSLILSDVQFTGNYVQNKTEGGCIAIVGAKINFTQEPSFVDGSAVR